MKKKIICFDLDGVICSNTLGNYKEAKPIKLNIKKINELYDQGNYIKIYTARFMGRSNDNANKAKKKAYDMTVKQLKKWKLKYHKLFFGKISYDIIIDDKALGFKKGWRKLL
tara:strand:+ start:221 stop:556 length:336 start_codon:yes stop_codon:yes gene_type:complete